MNIKVQRITKTAKIRTRAHDTDTCYDLYADKIDLSLSPRTIKVHTGIAIQPEEGYYVEIFPRSSLSKKYMQLANSVGIIDESYTGEIIFIFNRIPVGLMTVEGKPLAKFVYDDASTIEIGEKIGQMVVRKRIDADFVEVSYLDNTVRGDGGFGSTGK